MPQIRYNNDVVGPVLDYSQSYDMNEYETLWNESLARNNKDNVFYQWFNSEETADRDFARQMVGQMYQNWYESAPEQMKRLKEAGVDVNLAAASVAGNAAGAAPMHAPQSDANAPVSEIANAANAVTGGVKSLSDASKAVTEAHEINQLLPWKGLGLAVDTLLSLENVGLTRAQAQSVAIANHYAPTQFQLGVAKARLELPMLIAQCKVYQSEYERNITQCNLMDQQAEESRVSADLMTYKMMHEKAAAARDAAEASLIHKRFELLRSMNWDPATGLEGLFGTYLVNPSFNESDLNQLVDNLAQYSYDMAKYRFLGDNNLGLNDGRSLFELRSDEAIATSQGSRRDIPVEVSVGPFKTSTNLRDFFHEKNNKKSLHDIKKMSTYYNK